MSAAATGSGFAVLIPARMASTRLPDKPLADIAGIPMVVRVAQRARRWSTFPRGYCAKSATTWNGLARALPSWWQPMPWRGSPNTR